MKTPTVPFVFARHPLRDLLPSALQGVIQDGFLEGMFHQALFPELLFPRGADIEPLGTRKGQKVTMQRRGLLTPVTDPITGSDPSAATYSVEYFEATLEQYGNSVDTDMLANAAAAARLYAQDVITLGRNAGQSLNRICRNRLMAAYAGGRTWTRTTATSDTSLQVHDVTGFTHVLVDGVPTAVSASTPLDITIAGVANTVEGVNTGTRTLTLGSAVADTAGDAVVAANAPVSFRPTARDTAADLISSDVADIDIFLDAVARLREMHVPTMDGGFYEAHVGAQTTRQLLDDTKFANAFQGQHGSTEVRNGLVTEFGGIRFVQNQETVAAVPGDGQTLTVYQPIVCGAGHLIATPFEALANLLSESGVGDVPNIEMIDTGSGIDVALIVRPPQDRLQQVVATTWSWVGDFAVPSDDGTGDDAMFKRAVVIEHA